MTTATNWRNRIIGIEDVAPDSLLANPANWRIHPKHQQDALEGVLNEVGWVQQVIVNQRTGNLINGHLHVTLAMRRNKATIPVNYVDLSPEEESLILATLDPLSALAATDTEKLDALLRDVQTGKAGVQAMLAELAERKGIVHRTGWRMGGAFGSKIPMAKRHHFNRRVTVRMCRRKPSGRHCQRRNRRADFAETIREQQRQCY